MSYNPWEVIQLPTEAKLFDIGFTNNLDHGWIVGSNATLLETTDGGKTWDPKIIDIEEKVRLTSVSFYGNEGLWDNLLYFYILTIKESLGLRFL